MSIDQRLRHASAELRSATARRLAWDQRPVRRVSSARAGLVLATTLVLLVFLAVAGLTLRRGSPTRLSTAGGTTAGAVWQQLPADTSAFPANSQIASAIAWHGGIIAVGSVANPSCAPQDSACSSVSAAEWVWRPGGSWSRRPVSGLPEGEDPLDLELVATPDSLLLIEAGAPGAGWGSAPPPYERLTQIWSSSSAQSWQASSIPQALVDSAVGPAVFGHGQVLLVATNPHTRQTGVWILKASRWSFHPTTGTTAAGMFGWFLSATPSGYLAGGSELVGAKALPALWSSADGIAWHESALSSDTGQVTTVAVVAGQELAGGGIGPLTGAGTAYWRYDGHQWRLVPVGAYLGYPSMIASVDGMTVSMSSRGLAVERRGVWTLPTSVRGQPASTAVAAIGPAIPVGGHLVTFVLLKPTASSGSVIQVFSVTPR